MKNICCFIYILLISAEISAQQKPVIDVVSVPAQQKVVVTVDNKPFTEFIYADSLPKPVLFPIYASNSRIITRGYPLAPRPGEPTDHPHHFGLWMNYENVNGLDFWNNSFAIPSDKKQLYGWIRTTGIREVKSGAQGVLTYTADWTDQQKKTLLTETTHIVFSAADEERTIDRTTTLVASEDLSFEDVKDGFLGLRVAHELELPSAQPKTFTDDKGRVTAVAPDTLASGNYLTSAGLQGDSAWGTRAVWCMLYGKKDNDSISIVIIDHPSNPGYPTYWHARGYGLFAANPLGQKIFSNGKEALHFRLKKGQAVTFRYRIVIAAGKQRLGEKRINALTTAWASEK